MGDYWWRSWHGAPMDHKWPVIALRAGVKVGVVSAVAWAVIDYASQQPNRGDVTGFDTEAYAVYSGFPEDEIKAVIKAMEDKGVIQNGRLSNWEKRQPKREDDSYERVKRYREKKRSVTQGNAPDTDTDTDTEYKEDEGAQSSPLSDAFTRATNITPYKLDEWVAADQELTRQGVTPEEIPIILKKMDEDGLKYSGLFSLVKTGIWVHLQRLNNRPIFNPKPNNKSNGKSTLADSFAAIDAA